MPLVGFEPMISAGEQQGRSPAEMIAWINNKKINIINFELLSEFCIFNTSAKHLHTQTTVVHHFLDIHSYSSIM